MILWRRAALSGILLAFLAAPASFATPPDTALGADGELYLLRTGTYGDLFPGRRQTDKNNRVLALEIQRPGELPARLLVPQTDGPESEEAASLIYEDQSRSLYLLWESRSGPSASYLNLASYDGSRWSPAIEVSGNPASVKTLPRLAITHDTVQVAPPGGGEKVEKHRTVAHLAWTEAAGSGAVETFYTPIILVDGAYLGWNPVYRLNDFDVDPPAGAVAAGDGSAAVAAAPSIAGGSDGRAVVISFASPVTHRLCVLRVDFLPGELQQLADKLRSAIIDLGRSVDLTQPAGRTQLADKARAALTDNGGAFEPEVISTIGDRIHGQITAGDSTDLAAIGEGLRSTIIDLGARLSHRGLRPLDKLAATTEPAAPRIDQINDDPHRTNQSAAPGALGHLIELAVASTRPAPQVGAGDVEVFVSASGRNVIVSWALADRVLYRESTPAGWSDVREVQLSDSVDLARAYETVARRVRGQ